MAEDRIKKAIIGIDPGKNGGIAIIDDYLAIATKMPETEKDVYELLRLTYSKSLTSFAYIEKVASSPQMGVRSAFTFGREYGFLFGCLYALGIPFETVAPAKWQKALGCLSRGDKNITKTKAQQLFPSVPITHAVADALLIAEYGRRVRV